MSRHRASSLVISASLMLAAPSATNAQQALTLDQAIEQLGSQITRSLQSQRYLRLAVTDLPDLDDRGTMLGRYIAERLTTALSGQPGFAVMERRRVSQVLTELNFGAFDLVQPENARRFGRMLGVDAIVTGTLSALPDRADVDVRVVDIETSNILTAARATVLKTSDVSAMLVPVASDSARRVTSQASAPATAAPTAPASPPAPRAGSDPGPGMISWSKSRAWRGPPKARVSPSPSRRSRVLATSASGWAAERAATRERART